MSGQARDINSAKPYGKAAGSYVAAGWGSPLPVAKNQKEGGLPLDRTGRGKPYATAKEIREWVRTRGSDNICLRMMPVDIDVANDPEGNTTTTMHYDVIGIDVDDYESKGKMKRGGRQLKELEKEYGPLPATWRSTARGAEGASGIRFFLAPAGLHWRGKAHKDIDIISPGYRYAVVWPSWNPKAQAQYQWFDERNGHDSIDHRDVGSLPEPTTLPFMPEAWVELLTNGHMPDTGVDIDMDSSVDDIRKWVMTELPGADSETLCEKYKAIVEYWQRQIEEDASSHDKILEAHWNMACMATEGHSGWLKAVTAVENIWIGDVKSRGKRSIDEFRREIFRSGVQAMRKLKGQIETGSRRIQASCTCYVPSEEEQRMFQAAMAGNGSTEKKEIKNGTDGAGSGLDIPRRKRARSTRDRGRSGDTENAESIKGSAKKGVSGTVPRSPSRSTRPSAERAEAAGIAQEPDWDSIPEYGTSHDVDWDEFGDGLEGSSALDPDGVDRGDSSLAVGVGGHSMASGGADEEEFNESSLFCDESGYWPSGCPGGRLRDPGEYELSDAGNAQHWADMHKGNAYYVPALNDWVMWTGKSWILGDGAAQRSFARVGRRQRRYAEILAERAYSLAAADDPGAKAAVRAAQRWAAWADRSGNVAPRDAALKWAETLLHIEESDLNQYPNLLACNNGVIDLDVPAREVGGRVDRMRELRREDGLTLTTGVDYVPWGLLMGGPEGNLNGQYDRWLTGDLAVNGLGELRTLADEWDAAVKKFMPSADVRRYVQKLVGYTLHGENSEKLAVFLYGDSNTGKSTFLNAILKALGDYAAVVDLSIFKERQTNPQLVYALPKRLITMSEGSDKNVLHADVFKRLTGGDPISAELKYSNERVTRVPSFVPWIATNIEPNIPGADQAVINRIRVIPFDQIIGEDTMDGWRWVRLTKSRKFGAVVLSWAVAGWEAYLRDGRGSLKMSSAPVAVLVETQSFASEFSDLSVFIKQCLVRAKDVDSALVRKIARRGDKLSLWPDGWVCTFADVYDLYWEWCNDQKIQERERLSANSFGRQMKALGMRNVQSKRDGHNAKRYHGVRMSPPPGLGEHIVQADLDD